MADLNNPKTATKSKGSKSLPYGVTQETWDATENLRKQYRKLLVLQEAHDKEKHPWNSYCLCPEMGNSQEMLAYVMSQIKMCLLKVNHVAAMIARGEAARTFAEIDAQMLSPDEMFKVMSEVNAS